MKTFKFGTSLDYKDIPYQYNNIWCTEKTTGPDRLVIAPKDNHIDLLLELAKTFESPFGLLYVLIIPRCGHKNGRYQSAGPLTDKDLEEFCKKYKSYLEQDARHHLWIASTKDNSLLVYDNHNVIYAYGDLEKYKKILKKHSFNNEKVVFPCPHIHKYNQENDKYENMIMDEQWKYFPLQDEDDL